MKEKKINQERKNIEDYFSTPSTSFFGLLKEKKKWKELYEEKEAKIAIMIAMVSTFLLVIAYKNSDFEQFNEMLQNLSGIIISSLIGMLGFIISGLAISTGTITNKLIKSVDKEQKVGALIGILYSFYFVGAVIGVAIICWSITYIFLYSELILNLYMLVVAGFFLSYLFLFCIFYSISLLGTCIRLFVVGYMYSSEAE